MKTTPTDTEETLLAIATIGQIEAQIQVLTVTLGKLKQDVAAARSPFKVGDKIEWGHPSNRMTGIISGIRHHYSDASWVIIRIKKDGSEGAAVSVENYHHPKLVK